MKNEKFSPAMMGSNMAESLLGAIQNGFYHFKERKLTNMVHTKVVELQILYRTIYKQIYLYVTKVMKTLLKAVGEQNMVVKNLLCSPKCDIKLLFCI